VDKLKDIKLSILVNNVGGTSVQAPEELYSALIDCSLEVVDGLININARFLSQITRLILPQLYKRPRSLILNISSAAEQGLPYLSVYSATKSYTKAFSNAMTVEMKAERKNVEVLAIMAGSVQVTSNSQPLSLFHPSAETFAREVMRRIGCGRKSVYAYLPHALQAGTMTLIPDWLATSILIRVLRARKQEAEVQTKTK
jgi:17beta-estradiol 17-dehydrogenase / very-long-chain 3-oxoacyl-CoA reductase